MANRSNVPHRLRFAAAVAFVVAVGLGLWLQARAKQEARTLEARLGEVQKLLRQDRPEGYRKLLDVARATNDDSAASAEIQASAAYAASILALEYHVPELAKEARGWLAQVARSPQEGRETTTSATLVRCAEALMVWADGDLEQARAELALLSRDTSVGAYSALEALRLNIATHADKAQIDAAATKLEEKLADEARGWVYLGMFALAHKDIARAQKAFDCAHKSSPSHTGARMGQLWLVLGDNRPNHDHQEVAEVLHEVDTALADESLAGPERAMGLIVRARARQLEGESNAALRDIAEAQHVCPGHPFLDLPDVLPRPSDAAGANEAPAKAP